MKKPIQHQMEAIKMKIKPSFHIDSETLGELKKWKVGEKYTLKLMVKEIGMHITREGKYEGDFEILKAESADENSKDNSY